MRRVRIHFKVLKELGRGKVRTLVRVRINCVVIIGKVGSQCHDNEQY